MINMIIKWNSPIRYTMYRKNNLIETTFLINNYSKRNKLWKTATNRVSNRKANGSDLTAYKQDTQYN